MVTNALPIGKKTKFRNLIWLVVLLSVSGGAYGYWRYRQTHQPPPVTFQFVALERRNIVGKVTATGTLQARVTVLVGSQVSGRIQKLFADYNSTVKKGDVVAKIDPTLFEAAVAKEQANYLAIKANLEQAKAQALLADKKLTRLRALGKDQLATQADIDSAETDLLVAKAQITSAEASLQQEGASLKSAQTNLSFTTIVSPIDGTVISRSVDVGQTVAASLQAPTIFTIAEDLRKMQVSTNVSEGDVGRLSPGMKTSFTVDAFPGQRFFGAIVQIRNAAQTIQNVVTYNAIIEFDNPELKLRPGMTASVSIIYAERNDVLAVPNAALRFNPPPEANLKVPERNARARPGGSAQSVATPLGEASGTPTASSAESPSGRRRWRDSAGSSGGASDTKTIWVPNGASAEPVMVKVGLSDGTYTELLGEGLSAGGKVIIDSIVNGKPSGSSSNSAGQSKSGATGMSGGMRRMF
jgi:HlyD family secretion protein